MILISVGIGSSVFGCVVRNCMLPWADRQMWSLKIPSFKNIRSLFTFKPRRKLWLSPGLNSGDFCKMFGKSSAFKNFREHKKRARNLSGRSIFKPWLRKKYAELKISSKDLLNYTDGNNTRDPVLIDCTLDSRVKTKSGEVPIAEFRELWFKGSYRPPWKQLFLFEEVFY